MKLLKWTPTVYSNILRYYVPCARVVVTTLTICKFVEIIIHPIMGMYTIIFFQIEGGDYDPPLQV